MQQTKTKIKRWYSKRQLADRYSVSTRTIERWEGSRKFPPATKMPNGRYYWPDTVIEAHERGLVGGAV